MKTKAFGKTINYEIKIYKLTHDGYARNLNVCVCMKATKDLRKSDESHRFENFHSFLDLNVRS